MSAEVLRRLKNCISDVTEDVQLKIHIALLKHDWQIGQVISQSTVSLHAYNFKSEPHLREMQVLVNYSAICLFHVQIYWPDLVAALPSFGKVQLNSNLLLIGCKDHFTL